MAEITVTKENYKTEVSESKIPVLIDFWASWCGPCMMLSPIIKEVADENEGIIKVCKINVDEEPELAEAFRVNSIPTLVVMKDGAPVKQSVGYQSKEKIMSLFA